MEQLYAGIDLSTKAGLVISNKNSILFEDEIMYRYSKDPERPMFIVDKVIDQLRGKNVLVGIEGYAHGAQGSSHSFQYMIGGMMRAELVRNNIPYYEITPNQLKLFACNYGSAKKETMIIPIKKRWDYFHPSDNVMDAFILSEIVKAIDMGKEYPGIRQHEKEVLMVINSGYMNREKDLKESAIPTWRSKAFNEEKKKRRVSIDKQIKDIKTEIRIAKKAKSYEGIYKSALETTLEKHLAVQQEIKDSHVKYTMDWE